jgi:hypothetical protein
MPDERRHFVLVGRFVGHYGREGDATGSLSDTDATAFARETTERLRAAGLDDRPAWHFEFEADR